jgi:hypothetical protein
MNALSRLFTRRIHSLRRILFVVPLLLALSATAVAAQPLTGTFSAAIIGRDVTYVRNGKPTHRWAGVYNLKLDTGDNVPVYCVQFGVRVNYGDRYRSDGTIQQLPNGCQIRYLLNKYPASTAKTADEAAARQLAIWAFSDKIDPLTITDTTTTLRDRVVALVKEAQAAPCPATRAEVPDLTLEPPTATAQAGQTVNYTVRVAPRGIAPSVSVAVSGAATLADGSQQGNIPLDAQGVATFSVVGASAGTATISVNVPYQLDSGVVFSPIDDTHKTQRLVMANKQKFVARASAQAFWAGSGPPPSLTPTVATPTVATPTVSAPTATAKSPKKQPKPTEQTPTATPETPAIVAGEQATPTAEAVVPQPAGGAPPAQPRQLPNTGAAGGGVNEIVLGIAALLLAIGMSLRRRGMRR